MIRDAVVQKWFERTRGFTKQNKANVVEQSPIVQIKEVSRILYVLRTDKYSGRSRIFLREGRSSLNPPLCFHPE